MAKNEEPEGNKPADKVVVWPIEVARWENEREGSSGKFTASSFKVSRAFTKDKGKTWENTPYLRTRDLPLVILAMQKAFEKEAMKGKKEED